MELTCILTIEDLAPVLDVKKTLKKFDALQNVLDCHKSQIKLTRGKNKMIIKGTKKEQEQIKKMHERIKSGKMKFEYALTKKIDKYLNSNLSVKFFKEILGFKEKDVLVSDESTLFDFPENKDYYKKIKKVFKVETDKKYLWEILKQIKEEKYNE